MVEQVLDPTTAVVMVVLLLVVWWGWRQVRDNGW